MKDTTISFDNAIKELEQKKKNEELLNEAANARSPLNDPGRSAAAVVEQMEKMNDDGTAYKMPYQRPDLNVQWVEAPGSNMTPMQAQIHNQGIDHNNW
jgi:hypothetical protein